MTLSTRDLSRKHEAYVAELLGMRVTKNSGATWRDKLDGMHSRLEQRFAYCFDGKASQKKSIGVSIEMWNKVVEQSTGERPCMPLRFYGPTDKLDVELDLVVLSLDDFAELLEAANGATPNGSSA